MREIDGIPVTSLARMIIDVARTVGIESGVCAGDEAVRRRMCTRSELEREAAAALSRPGAVIARIRTEMRRQERLGIGPSA